MVLNTITQKKERAPERKKERAPERKKERKKERSKMDPSIFEGAL